MNGRSRLRSSTCVRFLALSRWALYYGVVRRGLPNLNRPTLQRWLATVVFAALLGTAHAEDVPTAKVAFVGCPGIGGADPGPWPVPKGAPKVLPSPPTVPAARIAYYRANNGPGVFAPRGWHCQAWGGSSGSFIIVTPTAQRAVIPREAVKGPGVIAIKSYGGTSGRFDVAEVSARLFPKVMADFIARVKAEGFPSPDFSKIKPFPHDEYTYLTPKLVVFATPAHRDGHRHLRAFRTPHSRCRQSIP
jgi:hypothetical protein